jgi:hypothetical protein
VLMHAEIAKAQSPSSVQVVEIGLERNHDGCHRSSFGTGLDYDDVIVETAESTLPTRSQEALESFRRAAASEAW